MSILNPMRAALLASYPDIDLLPIDPADPESTQEAVRATDPVNGTGDTLFDFLLRELDKDVTEDPDEALSRLQKAVDDIQAVMSHIENAPALAPVDP